MVKNIIDRIKNRKMYRELSEAGKQGAVSGGMTRLMVDAFSPDIDKVIAQLKESTDRFNSWLPEISNPGKKWWQFWKPEMVPNPDYNPEPISIDIVRGRRYPTLTQQ